MTDITIKLARVKEHVRNIAFNGQNADGIVQEAIDEIDKMRASAGTLETAIASERDACVRLVAVIVEGSTADCENRGVMDPETGEIPCSLEAQVGVCLCAEKHELGSKIVKQLRARATPAI